MKVIILTSSLNGMAAYAVPIIFKESSLTIAMVVFNEGQVVNKKKFYKKKINKVFNIGLLGALNGIKMRKWFGRDVEKYLDNTDLENFCSMNNIPFQRTPSINSDITRELFNKAGADIGISLGNSFIGKSVFSICPLGMINIHGEQLPGYQNAQSIIWQLYNGSAETGFTIHKVSQKIDQGDILYQEKFPISFKDTLADTVSYNCALITKKACIGLIKVLSDFWYYNVNSQKQTNANSYTTPTWKQFKRIKEQYKKLKDNLTVE